jgi:hypothetical protein
LIIESLVKNGEHLNILNDLIIFPFKNEDLEIFGPKILKRLIPDDLKVCDTGDIIQNY